MARERERGVGCKMHFTNLLTAPAGLPLLEGSETICADLQTTMSLLTHTQRESRAELTEPSSAWDWLAASQTRVSDVDHINLTDCVCPLCSSSKSGGQDQNNALVFPSVSMALSYAVKLSTVDPQRQLIMIVCVVERVARAEGQRLTTETCRTG